MDFKTTVETLANWINSCKHYEQLNLCRDAIEKFVRERFKNHVTMREMAINEDHLFFLISEKERVLDHK